MPSPRRTARSETDSDRPPHRGRPPGGHPVSSPGLVRPTGWRSWRRQARRGAAVDEPAAAGAERSAWRYSRVGGAAVLLSLALFRGFPNPVHPLLVDGVITAALVRVLLAPNRWGYAWWCRSRLVSRRTWSARASSARVRDAVEMVKAVLERGLQIDVDLVDRARSRQRWTPTHRNRSGALRPRPGSRTSALGPAKRADECAPRGVRWTGLGRTRRRCASRHRRRGRP